MEPEVKADSANSGGKADGKNAESASRGIGGYVMTWLLSVASAVLVGWAWVHTHPANESMAVVDLNGLMLGELAKLDRRVRPDMSEEEKQQLAKQAMDVAKKVENAINQVAKECGCVVISAAAVAANGSRKVRDMTLRAQELVSQ